MKKILIVDDEQFLASNLAELLNQTGKWEASVVHTGKDAMQLLEQQHFDVFLLDLHLPDIYGNELAGRILEINPGARFVFMSVFPNLIENLKDIAREDWPVLEKPFSIKQLEQIFN